MVEVEYNGTDFDMLADGLEPVRCLQRHIHPCDLSFVRRFPGKLKPQLSVNSRDPSMPTTYGEELGFWGKYLPGNSSGKRKVRRQGDGSKFSNFTRVQGNRIEARRKPTKIEVHAYVDPMESPMSLLFPRLSGSSV